MAISACSAPDTTVKITVIGDPHTLSETGARLSAGGQLLNAASHEGLVTLDDQGQISPALADRWIVTNDGLSYIFRLRDGTWPDGTRLSGETARRALEQSLAMLRETSLALDLANISDVRAMAGRVVEIRLSHQVPDLLQLLAQSELGLNLRGRGAGPMLPKKTGRTIVLSPIAPEKRGLPASDTWQANAHKLRLGAAEAAAAVDAFDAKRTDAVLAGTAADYPLASRFTLRNAVRIDPVSGLFGLIATNANGVLGNPDTREALAMAIDRAALGKAIGYSGWIPSTRIITLPNEARPDRWSDMSLGQRQDMAKTIIARWRGGSRPEPKLAIYLGTGPGADALFTVLQADFLGIGVALRRTTAPQQADLRLIDAVARYARPAWYLNQLHCNVVQGLCSESADALVAKARQTDDPAARAVLERQAEAKLLASNSFIPLGQPLRWSLLNNRITGFATNRWAAHPLFPMAVSQK